MNMNMNMNMKAKRISLKQLLANRENAKKSTGPTSPEGAKKSSLNSRRHGLTGQFTAMTPQDREAFDKHCAALLADFKPEGYRESQLAISIAQDQWRLHRARALETNIYAWEHGTAPGQLDCVNEEIHACLAQARTWMQDSKNFQLLSLYESRIRRTVEKNEKQLEALQSERKFEHAKALEEALLLAQLDLMKEETVVSPRDAPPKEYKTSNGFVFSTRELHEIIARTQRLHEAAFFQKHAWNSKAPFQEPLIQVPRAA